MPPLSDQPRSAAPQPAGPTPVQAVAGGRGLFSLSATELAQAIAAGVWSASDVTAAYLQRQAEVNPRLNAVVVSLAAQARERAVALDRRRAAGEACGPLHGVPISIKECFDYVGTPTTLGVPGRRHHCAEHTSPPVQVLEAAGAVVLGKTNVPEMLLYLESDNPVYGRTNNPWNAQRTPGGSSGGEAAIIAAGGAQFGLGSDLGGSIRLPAHYCGIHGFKPTSRRLSLLGTIDEALAPGQEAVVDQPGPLARHVDDLIVVMELLVAAQLRQLNDPTVPPVPLAVPPALPTGLRVGIYQDDGFYPVASACRRVVEEAGAALAQQGVTVVPFVPPAVDHAMEIYFGLLAADGGQWAHSWLRGGGHDRRLADLVRLARLPRWSRRILAAVLAAMGQRHTAAAVRRFGRVNVSAYWTLVEAQRQYQLTFQRQMDAAGVDILLCPPAATPAMTHGASYYLTGMASATMLYNLLGLPAGTVAAGQVRDGESGQRRAGRDWVDRAAATVDRDSAGLPVGVQVVGRPWCDGLVLRVMKSLEQYFRGDDSVGDGGRHGDYPVWPWRRN